MKTGSPRLIVASIAVVLLSLTLRLSNQLVPHPAANPPTPWPSDSARTTRPGGEIPRGQSSTAPEPSAGDIRSDAFEHFDAWVDRYLEADPATRAQRIPEGRVLAGRRRRALHELIASDPEAALSKALPYNVRQQLPADVGSLLEIRASFRGDLTVLGNRPFPRADGQSHPPDFRPIRRLATATDGRVWEAFAYGRRVSQTSLKNVPLHGIAIDDCLALDENPLRRLDEGEPPPAASIPGGFRFGDAASPVGDPICGVSGRPAASGVAADIGGSATYFCESAHVDQLDGQLRLQEQRAAPAAGTGWSLGHKRILFIPVEFPDEPGSPITNGDAQALFVKVADFFRENSAGAVDLEFVLSPTVTMPAATSAYREKGLEGQYKLRNDAREALRALNDARFVPEQFDLDCVRHTTVFPQFSGSATVGGPGCWLQASDLTVVAHELGHNFGLHHANAWLSDAPERLGIGRPREYGNPFDVMGGGAAPGAHFGAERKLTLGWLPGAAVLETSTNGTYRIAAHDAATAGGLASARVLRIQRRDGSQLSLEARAGFPTRTSPPELLVHYNGALVDTTPRSSWTPESDHADAPLHPGHLFADREGEVWIEVRPAASGNPSELDVTIQRGAVTGETAPTIAISPSRTQSQAGLALTFEATVDGAAGRTVDVAWDFDDGTGGYGTRIEKSWARPGLYLVTATAYDLHGNSSRAWATVRLGNPRLLREVYGRVTVLGEPLPDAVISIGDRRGFTDQDGRYAIVGARDGSYVARLVHPLFPLGRTRAVAISGGSVTNADFALSGPAIVRVDLLTPEPDAEFLADRSVRFSATATLEPGAEVRRLDFVLDGTPFRSEALDPHGTYNATLVPPTPGRHQLVAVGTDSSGATVESARITFEVLDGPPLNDAFAARQTITELATTVTNINLRATREPGEPGVGDASAWYRWVAPGDGGFNVSCVPDLGGDASVEIYRGDRIGALTRVDDSAGRATFFQATGGTEYNIRVATAPAKTDRYRLSITKLDPPANDALERSIHLGLFPSRLVYDGSNRGASREPGEPDHSAPGFTATTWYNFQAVRSGLARIAVNRPDVQLALYRGTTFGQLQPIAAGRSSLTWFAEEKETIELAVATSANDFGTFGIVVDMLDVAANDTPDTAYERSGTRWSAFGDTRGSTRDATEPDLLGGAGVVWWTWTAPQASPMQLSLAAGVPTATGMRIEALDPSGTFTVMAGATNATGNVELRFNAAAGTKYRIAVATSTGTQYTLQLAPRRSNDFFEDAVLLVDDVINGDTTGGTTEAGEPFIVAGGNVSTVWYRWASDAQVTVFVTVATPNARPEVAVFGGSSIGSLTRITSAQSSGTGISTATFSAAPGITYYFRVATRSDQGTPFTLSVSRQLVGNLSANDLFDQRVRINAPEFTVTANTSRASRELADGEPRHAGRLDGGSLWWEWTAPESGGFAITATPKGLFTYKVFVGVYEVDWANALVGLGAIAGDEANVATAGFHAERGHHYFFVVDQAKGQGGIVTLSLKRGPENDDFANASVLLGDTVAIPAKVNGASIEPDELPHGAFDERSSVWFRWTAPDSRGYELSVFPDARYSVAAYQGTALTNLARQTPISVAADGGNYTSLRARAGQTYYIAVTAPGPTQGNPIFYIVPGPANDEFANRLTLEGESALLEATSIGATLEPGEPPHSNGTFGASVWWRWTAPVTGGFSIEAGDLGAGVANIAHSGAQQPRVAVYQGSNLSSLTPVARGELGRAVFFARQGATYAIAVADAGQTGTRFNLRLQRGPLNDNFDNRDLLEGTTWSIAGSLQGATLEPGEPTLHAANGLGTVWWEWTAPSTGGFALTARSPKTTPAVSIFTGNSIGSLASILRLDPAKRLTSSTTFHALAGQTYQIALVSPDVGESSFQLSLTPGPSNDDLERATDIAGAPLQQSAPLDGCSIEPGESPLLPGVLGTTWHRWTPPADGRYRIAVSTPDAWLVIGVHTGSALSTLRELGRGITPARGQPAVVQVDAVRGVPLYLSIGALDVPTGTARIAIGATVFGDDFAARIPLPAGRETWTTNLTAMSVEPDDPRLEGIPQSETAWFSWRAPRAGGFGLRVRLAETPAIAAVFRGSELNRLQAAGHAVASAAGADACVNFRADFGETFAFLISATNSLAGPIEVQVLAAAPNDDFANAAVLPPTGAGEPVTSLGATLQNLEPPSGDTFTGGSLWWNWSPPHAGPFVVRLFDDSGPSGITVYRGDSLATLRRIARSSAAETAQLNLLADTGLPYRIAVTPSAARLGNLRIVIAEPPANDSFATRTPLSGYLVSGPATTVGATREFGEPSHGGRADGASIWFTWTAPDFGRFVITDGWAPVEDPRRDAALRVFTGATLGTLTEIPLDDAPVGYGQPRALILAATRGVTYHIAVDSPIASMREFTLRIAPKPLNDDLADSVVVTGDDVLLTGDNSGATPDFVPGARTTPNSIWFSWVAPSDGYASVLVAAGEDDVIPVVNLHYEDQLGRLNWLGSGTDNPVTADFFVSGGTTYHFAVGTTGRPSTNLVFSVQLDRLGDVRFLEGGSWFKGYPYRWTVGPLPPWLTQNHTFHDGPDAVRSGPSVLGTTWMETAVEGPATLRFWWRVSCHPTEAFLAVMNRSQIGGDVPLLQVSGERGWQPVTLDLPPGLNLIRWAYTRRTPTGILGRDAGWIDNVEVLPPTVPAANFDPPSFSLDGSNFRTVLRAAPDRLSTVEVSDDLQAWTPWFSQVPASGRIEIPVIATTNRTRLFLRAVTP